MVLGGVGLGVGGLFCGALILSAGPGDTKALYYIIPPFLMIAVAYLIPGFVGGLGLLFGKAWGRLVIALLSLLLLLLIPVGTALGGFGLWALYRSGTPQPAQAAGHLPVTRAPISPQARNTWALLMLIAATGAGFIVVIGLGFRLHDDPAPAVLNEAFLPAIAVLALSVWGFFVVRPVVPWSERPRPLNPIALHRHREKMRAEQARFEEERRARIAMLAADPARADYARRIQAGEAWSDAEIAYDMDPAAVVTCRHLRPIEQAMRAAGLAVRLIAPSQVRAPCLIDEAGLFARFQPARSVKYRQFYYGGRSAEDDPAAFLICEACQSTIDAVHPDLTRPETPWFPPRSP